MNTDSLIFMIVSESIIAFVTIYFFVKILRSKKQFTNENSVTDDELRKNNK